MENQKLTQRPQTATISEQALVHVVEPHDISQGPDGSSYKFPAANLFMAGQDNIDIRKQLRIEGDDTSAQILAKINAIPQYVVNEKQSVWFRCQARISQTEQKILKYKMLNKGKGVYGAGGIQLIQSDIELVYSNEAELMLADALTDPDTDIINFGNITGQTISQWLNNRTFSIVVQSQDEGYTLFRGTVGDMSVSYLWIGEPGVYGQGEQQSALADFQILDDTVPQYDNNSPLIVNVGFIETMPVIHGLHEKLNEITTVIAPIDTPVLFTCYTLGETGAGTAHTFLFLGGKGTWGYGGNNISTGMLYPLLEKPIATEEIEDNDTTLIIPLGEIQADGFLAAANTEEHDFTETDVEYYFSYYIGDILYLALFIGAPGVYGGDGANTDDFAEADFAQVTNGNISGVPTLQQVNADGGGTTDPLVVTGPISKVAHFADSIEFSSYNGHSQKSAFKDTNHDSIYNHPTDKPGLHTYAMLSDLTLQTILDGNSEATISSNLSMQVIQAGGSVAGTFSIIEGAITLSSTGEAMFSTAQSLIISSGQPLLVYSSLAEFYGEVRLHYPPINESSAVNRSYVDNIALSKADLEDGKIPPSQLPEYLLPLNVGQIIKLGKGFTINNEGNLITNTGSISEHEKGDLFRGISQSGKYIPYMRYKGIGDVNDFANHSYEIQISALLPDETGYIIPEE